MVYFPTILKPKCPPILKWPLWVNWAIQRYLATHDSYFCVRYSCVSTSLKNVQKLQIYLSRRTTTDRWRWWWWFKPSWSYLCSPPDTPVPCQAPPLIAWERGQQWRKRSYGQFCENWTTITVNNTGKIAIFQNKRQKTRRCRHQGFYYEWRVFWRKDSSQCCFDNKMSQGGFVIARTQHRTVIWWLVFVFERQTQMKCPQVQRTARLLKTTKMIWRLLCNWKKTKTNKNSRKSESLYTFRPLGGF